MKIILCISPLFFLFKNYGIESANPSPAEPKTCNFYFQYDTSKAKLKKFKSFSKRFFQAIRSNDTIYLKDHVIFPIVNSSLTDLDSSLERNKKTINQRYFFKNLSKLFPENLIKRIRNQAEFTVSNSTMPKRDFHIEVMFNDSGIDVNFTWIFIEKNDKYYFTNFRGEHG